MCPLRECFTTNDLLSFSWQIVDALSYMTSNDIVHRDVSAENCLLTENFVAKLSGFKRCMIKKRMGDADEDLGYQNKAIETVIQGEYSEKTDV